MDSTDVFNNCCHQTNRVPEINPRKSLADETSDIPSVINSEVLQVVKGRYLLTESECKKTSHFKCWDRQTKQVFLCRIFHEKYDKILLAYFRLKTESEDDDKKHHLIRPVHDVIPLSLSSSYVIIPPGIYENLHSYIRDRKCLAEEEARVLFRQICEMVHICHRNGVILRDLKLRKFFFIDRHRSKLQYESLDGSIILDNPDDDGLTEKIGCPLYVAPEVISTTSTFGGKAADIWALGVILYAMLTGAYPFNDAAGQAPSLFIKIVRCEYYVPTTLSAEAICLIRCILRRLPTQRPQPEEILLHPWFKVELSAFVTDSEEHVVPAISLPEENGNYDIT